MPPKGLVINEIPTPLATTAPAAINWATSLTYGERFLYLSSNNPTTNNIVSPIKIPIVVLSKFVNKI